MASFINRARERATRPVVRGGRLTGIDLVLIGWFTLLTFAMVVRPILVGLKDPLGVDAIVYTEAARALVSGGDPWRVVIHDIAYAAPPPSLIPYLPLVSLPEAVVGMLGVVVAFASALYAIRRLRLPLWWLLFPPTALGIAVGSSTLPMLALLVRAGVVADAVAVVTRVYAALPLAGERRWRGLAVGLAAIVATAPLLQWSTFIAERDHVADLLSRQSGGGGSALAVPWLIPFAIVFLLLLGRRRAAWLVVPALWPDAQLHYASIAMPVLAEMPIVAIALAFPLSPLWVVAGLGGQVAVDRVNRRWPPPAPVPAPDPPGPAPRG